MSSPAPPVTAIAAPAAPVPASAIGFIIGRVKETAQQILKQQKPWGEVLDRGAFTKPANLTEAAGRIRRNAAYFRVNYLVLMVSSCIISFLMHPSSLFVLGALLSGWIYILFVRQTPLVLNGRTLSDREKLMGMGAISFITIFFLTSVGTVFFSALSFSLAIVLAHGALREPDNLFIDEAESSQSFLGILTGPPTTAISAV